MSTTSGFGYQANQNAGYHFELVVGSDGSVTLDERFNESQGKRGSRAPRASVNAHRWNLVRDAVAEDFNRRLHLSKLRSAKWLKTKTRLAPHFGKELALLLWAIDGEDPTVIPRMVQNWRALAPEERWWFYTTINASGRRAGDSRFGWKAAIKIAFRDVPAEVGLSALRISSPDPDPAVESEESPSAQLTLGRLFAEPDRPEYSAN